MTEEGFVPKSIKIGNCEIVALDKHYSNGFCNTHLRRVTKWRACPQAWENGIQSAMWSDLWQIEVSSGKEKHDR